MRIAVGQINSTVGDLAGNRGRMTEAARRAAAEGAEIVIFPELSLTGYPPLDLVENPAFLERTAGELERLGRETADLDLAIICGYVDKTGEGDGTRALNRAAVFEQGRVTFRQTKMLLPNYDVFDEVRYFQPAECQALCEIRGRKVALTICEDAWNDGPLWGRRLYPRDPVEELAQRGASMLVIINASPYQMGKRQLRRKLFSATAARYGMAVIYVNLVGGNDQLVFDGSSFVMDRRGRVIAAARSFCEDLVVVDIDGNPPEKVEPLTEEDEAVYDALVLGTRDYARKCGFRRVLLGLSGGIDSSLTAAVAVDAVGRENVTGVAMPGPYSPADSLGDAKALAENLGIRFEVAPISGIYETFVTRLEQVMGGEASGIARENLQARLRGVTLMALSNQTGAIVLTTGNKSELAVGYCTLYGDMCGGLAVISDVPKTLVYRLSRVANRRHEGAIPENVFEKAPSAELRPGQKDTDSLPSYDVLDNILSGYVESCWTAQQIAAAHGYPVELVGSVLRMVDRSEFKRQQAAPGLKVTSKAFGMGRRFPIAQGFSE
ncbi:MAG: NAD+ synthase [Bryobacterales bacterium]|nr:NAD+ synthase [Bryobacterales bacterium]